MTLTGVLTVSLGLCLSLLLFVHRLRTVLSLLATVLLGTVGLIMLSLPPGIGSSAAMLLLAMDLTIVVTVMGILIMAGLKDRWTEPSPPRGTLGSLATSAVVLAVSLSFTLWGISQGRLIDFAWTLLLVSGQALMMRAHSLLDQGLGLMVLLFGIKLLYIALIVPLGVAELGVLNFVLIIAAMVIAYVSDVLHMQSDGEHNHRAS